MRKVMFPAAILLSAAAAMAQAPDSDRLNKRGISKGDPSQVVCITETTPGSPLHRRRICRTRAQWVEAQQEARQVVERIQSLKTSN